MDEDDPEMYCCCSCCALWIVLILFEVETGVGFGISVAVGLVIYGISKLYYNKNESSSSYSSSSSSSYTGGSSGDITYEKFLDVLNEEMAKALVNNMQRFINEHSYWDEERIKKFGAFVVVTLDSLEYKQLLNLAADYNVFKAFFEELDRRF